jgi:hypothetical protein
MEAQKSTSLGFSEQFFTDIQAAKVNSFLPIARLTRIDILRHMKQQDSGAPFVFNHLACRHKPITSLGFCEQLFTDIQVAKVNSFSPIAQLMRIDLLRHVKVRDSGAPFVFNHLACWHKPITLLGFCEQFFTDIQAAKVNSSSPIARLTRIDIQRHVNERDSVAPIFQPPGM